MSQRNAAAVLLLATALPGIGERAAAAERPALAVERAELAPEGAVLTFRLAPGLPDSLVERLEAGEALTVTYDVAVVRARRWWFNATQGRVKLSLTAQRDPVTRTYHLTRRRGGAAEPAAEAADLDRALAWLTSVEALALPFRRSPREGAVLTYRIQATLDRRLVLLVFPRSARSEVARGRVGEGP